MLTISLPVVGAVVIVPVVIATLVNVPAAAVPDPMVVLLIELLVIVTPEAVPPVIATADAFCVDIVPSPVISVFGIVALAVIGAVPVPLTYPVKVLAPVPPLDTTNMPPRVTTPLDAADGVSPVEPALKVETPPANEKLFQDPLA